MQFASDGYVLTGDALTLVGSNGAAPMIRVGDGSAAGAGMTATIGNTIAGSDGLAKIGLGTLVLTGANTYSGGTTVHGGALSVSDDGNLGDASGGLTLDGGTLQVTGTSFTGSARDIVLGAGGGGFIIADAGNTFTLAQALDGSGALDKAGAGTLVMIGNNSYGGGTTISAGTLQVGAGGTAGSLVGDVVDNGVLAFDRSDALAFAGVISGNGALLQQGSGTLVLDGNSSAFAGHTGVRSGSLIVGSAAGNGAALGGDVAVDVGATLGGHGSIGGDVVNAGMLAPGASIGTLSIHGDYTQTATGTLAIETDADGHADLLAIDGSATLDGSALVLAQQGDWKPRTDYTILTAGGGVSGEFGSATSSLLFLDPTLAYGANAVTLSLLRNDIAFESAARTRNQRATAAAADGLGWDNAAYVALTTLDADSAPQAFDALSGEVHASARTALLDDSRYLREAINQHLQAAGNGAASAWAAAWGHWARSDSDGNADAMRGDGLGFAVGTDIAIADRARVGAVIGTGQLTARADARASVVDIDSRHLGVYGSIQAGGLLLQGGAARSWQQAGSQRAIAFDGYADTAQADYDARTTQAYLDGSHAFAFKRGSLAPFLNLAQVKVRSEGFDETGGDAALHVDAGSSERAYATAGARWTVAFGSHDAVHWQGSVGWMHAFGGDDVPLNDARFLTGSDTFTIAGTPIADDAFALDAGLRWQADPHLVIDASYVGRFAGDARDQGARLTLNWAF
jgi:autotransporter-associated beta strand protein